MKLKELVAEIEILDGKKIHIYIYIYIYIVDFVYEKSRSLLIYLHPSQILFSNSNEV